jgi:integrase
MPRKVTTKIRGVYEKIPNSGVWWIRWKADGVLHREKAGSRQTAIDLYQKRKSDALAGVKMPANLRYKGQTLRVLGENAIEWYKSHNKSDLRTFTGRMNAIVSSLGNKVAEDIKPQDIDRWLSSHKEWSPATANRYKTVLSKAYQLALVSGHVTSNPARLVASRKENNSRLRYLRPDEEINLRESIAQRCPTHLPSFEFALHTGMRKREQFSLEWPQVDWERKAIHLTKTKNGSQRDVPMSRTCHAALLRLKEERSGTNEMVFQSMRYDAPIADPKKWFEGCVKESGIENFVWHDLRHTFCSRLVMRGVDIRTVAELAGHKSITMTMRYAHLSPEHNLAAIQKLDD